MNETPPTPPRAEPPSDELAHRRRVAQLGTEIAELLGSIVTSAKDYREIGVPAREWLDVVAANLPESSSWALRKVASYIAMPIDMALEMVAGDPQSAMAAGIRAARPSEPAEPTTVTLNMNSARRTAKELMDGLDRQVQPRLETQEASEMRNMLECFNAFDANALQLAETPATIRMHRVIERLFYESAAKRSGTEDATQAPALEVHLLLRSSAPIQFSGILSTTPEGGLRLMTPVPGQGGRLPVMMEQFFDYSDVVSVCIAREVTAEPGSRIIPAS